MSKGFASQVEELNCVLRTSRTLWMWEEDASSCPVCL